MTETSRRLAAAVSLPDFLSMNQLGGLSRDYSIPVFGASTWENDERAYMDGHHLLGPAAEEFSRASNK